MIKLPWKNHMILLCLCHNIRFFFFFNSLDLPQITKHIYNMSLQEDDESDYAYLLKSTKDNFMIDEDFKILDRIDSKLNELNNFRNTKTNESRKVLQSKNVGCPSVL